MATVHSTSYVQPHHHPAKDRTTWDGGYAHVTRRVERERPADELTVMLWRFEHHDTPITERGNWWHGADEALCDAIDRLARESAVAVELDTCTDSVQVSKGARGPAQTPGSLRRVADRIGIPAMTINDARQHVAAVETAGVSYEVRTKLPVGPHRPAPFAYQEQL